MGWRAKEIRSHDGNWKTQSSQNWGRKRSQKSRIEIKGKISNYWSNSRENSSKNERIRNQRQGENSTSK